MPFTPGEETGTDLAALTAGEYPSLIEMATEYVATADHYDIEFAFGLDLILDGLEKHRG